MAQTQFRSDDTVPWWLKYGNGSAGAYSSVSSATDNPIDSSCSGTVGTTSLTATNASFEVGEPIFIHQTRGTGVGLHELNQIAGYTAGTITTHSPLKNTYTDSGASQAQVIQINQWASFTQNIGHILTTKAWNGDVGGITVIMSNSTVNIQGSITAVGKGFRGGAGGASKTNDTWSTQGESSTGVGSVATAANGMGSGGGESRSDSSRSAAAAGGGHASSGGAVSGTDGGVTPGVAGGTGGVAELTTMVFGGAGGGSGANANGFGYTGSNSGGIIYIIAPQIIGITSLSVGGEVGGNATNANISGAGNGAGGSILIKTINAVGLDGVVAPGGNGWVASGGGWNGGVGSVGRIHVDYLVGVTGTSTPAASTRFDPSLQPHSGGAFFFM